MDAQTRTHAQSGRYVLSQKDSSLELILGHKPAGSGPNSGLKLRLILVHMGNEEDK